MTPYLTPDDPNAFLDIPLKEFPFAHPSETTRNKYVPCPKCKGHGIWNLTINAYGPGQHFQCQCGQCNGWGWIDRNITCIHEWKHHANLGNCYNRYVCTKCGMFHDVDSGD